MKARYSLVYSALRYERKNISSDWIRLHGCVPWSANPGLLVQGCPTHRSGQGLCNAFVHREPGADYSLSIVQLGVSGDHQHLTARSDLFHVGWNMCSLRRALLVSLSFNKPPYRVKQKKKAAKFQLKKACFFFRSIFLKIYMQVPMIF